jgi:hypothetical protein
MLTDISRLSRKVNILKKMRERLLTP